MEPRGQPAAMGWVAKNREAAFPTTSELPHASRLQERVLTVRLCAISVSVSSYTSHARLSESMAAQ